MLLGNETECFKRGISVDQSNQRQSKGTSRLAKFVLIAFLALLAGCSGKKDQKAMIDAINKSMNQDRIMVYLLRGHVSPKCSGSWIEAKPIPEQIVYSAAQKAGLITITPDGPDFWNVELVNPSPMVVEGMKRSAHTTDNGCDATIYGMSVAYKAVADVVNVGQEKDGKSEVEFTWKWTVEPTTQGAKLANALSPQERAELNDHLKNPVLDHQHDPSFNVTDMAQSGAPHTAKMVLSKSGNEWVAGLSQEGQVAEAKRRNEALQAQLTQLENALPKPGEWVRVESTDKMDGSKTVQFKALSEDKVQLSDHEERLLLVAGCDKNVSLFIVPGAVAVPNIRYKFDNGAATEDRWGVSDNKYLMEALVERGFLKRMVDAKTFKIEFTPLGRDPQIATFDMGNFKQLIQNETGCNFMKKAWYRGF